MAEKKTRTVKETLKAKKEPKVLTVYGTKMLFVAVVATFAEHYLEKHTKRIHRKAIKDFAEIIGSVFDDVTIVPSKDGNTVEVTVKHAVDEKSK